MRRRPEREIHIADDQIPRIQRILENPETVRTRGLLYFGSETHRLPLNDPLPESALANFEAARGVPLPADYRAFLQYAGNGGAGPCYGIFPLDRWDDFIDWVSATPRADVLNRPCPLFPGMERTPDWRDWFGET